MLRFEADLMFEDAGCICTAARLGILDLPPGPEPGPEMPKKKKPRIP